ncbi:MAG: monovalent cation/H+ antiporter subunit D family protein [Candidatus Latescibacteria bacterium]|nr:monovalent cation/H+ antiporter subunit D family protein [Candidatus Latescibacterota bacterium]
MKSEHLLPLFIALPLGAGFLIPLISLIREWLADVIAIITVSILVVFAMCRLSDGVIIYDVGGWTPPFGINLVEDGLSGLFHIIIAIVSFLIVIYSIGYMKRYTARSKYFCLLMLMIAGMNGVIASGDLFNIFVFLEIASISSYALVAFGIDREELEASFKYLVLGGLGSSFILFGIAFMYSITGTLNLADIARVLQRSGNSHMVQFISAMFIMGFGTKAALIPFHAWLPDAHPSAPAPISAMLSGLLIKALGVYCIIRIFFNVIGFNMSFSVVFIILGVLSMVIGALLAIGQHDFKRMLAYSSISQMGYIIFGLGLGNPLGIIGALFHLLNHAFFKSLLFLCSGAVEYATGTRDLRQLGGLWKKMPITSATCSIASMSISGIPPLGGFFSKLLIIIAAVQAYDTLGPTAYFLASVTVFVSFLTIVYFVKLQKMALFGALPEKLEKVHEVPASMWSVLIVLAAFCIAFGVMFPWFIGTLVEPAYQVMLETSEYIIKVLGSL